MKDMHSDHAAVAAIGPIAATADADSAAIDLQGYEGCLIGIALGIGGITFDTSNKIEIKVTECDTSDGTFTAVDDDDILGAEGGAVGTGGIVKSFVAAHAAPSVTLVGYVGGKRYIKVRDERTGTHGTATPISLFVIKGHPHIAPAVA